MVSALRKIWIVRLHSIDFRLSKGMFEGSATSVVALRTVLESQMM
jgi:hypothetical protein